MARILVNYTYNKMKDEYKIMDYTCGVFADLEVAILETNLDIREPLVVPIKNSMTVVDRKSYEKVHKKFFLIVKENGEVEENEQGNVSVWLPRNTDISKLRYKNGALVFVNDEPKDGKVSEGKVEKEAEKKPK